MFQTPAVSTVGLGVHPHVRGEVCSSGRVRGCRFQAAAADVESGPAFRSRADLLVIQGISYGPLVWAFGLRKGI